MAPNGHATTDSRPLDRSSQVSSRPKWHVRHGSGEFRIWQKENPTQHLSYEEWTNSKHVDGLSLYYAAMQIWDESESSEEEIEQPKVDARYRTARAQSAREPKKTLKINGNGLSRSVGSATPSATAQSEDLSPSSKKKRKARKKYLSQELVASDENEDIETATPNAEATTPSAPVITINGRRKSSNRKPKKKPLSEETILPEDEEEDSPATNGLITPLIASPLPVRSAPKPSAAVQSTRTPKKTILKLSTRKTPKETASSEEARLSDDIPYHSHAPANSTSNVATVSEPNITATIEHHGTPNADNNAQLNDVTALPAPTSESAAASRRGLRARRPAQQRPYSIEAGIYDESDDEVVEDEPVVQAASCIKSRRVSVASLSKEPLGQLDDETLAILQGSVDREPDDGEEYYGRAKHFKGKGRAWKKEESDEDLEFNPGKKKAAKAKAAKAKAAAQQPKKRGRPRKSNLSEDIVHDDSGEEIPSMMENVSPSPVASEGTARKTRKPPRKSVLSEELVKDDTDEGEANANDTMHMENATAATSEYTPAPKKRGRPRKSDQSVSSKASVAGNDEPTEPVSYTPKGTPHKSDTPKGEPKQTLLVVNDDVPAEKGDMDGAAKEGADAPTATKNVDIEAYMASVNAEDDEEEMCKCSSNVFPEPKESLTLITGMVDMYVELGMMSDTFVLAWTVVWANKQYLEL